ncbi:tail fiber domain-containing protein [Cronobacter turicensis]|uniref:tail fiber domain-containing protein n=1 Tax=Cronobacter turicensis TaxID=413502 RepID=UPI001413205C|nr:tail fiber domain-containing protein [Cronobacter turicensis]NHV08090.1 tail fiber domain-containing protein [Cronobacter turicensis]NHV63024.1 tail fiber domain-containing protein [Cronobacter turicensis]NHW09965.1 tail fiber domain-containing protein [Cronobacter turicensis]
MSAGTITLTNNSDTVTGAGTTFTDLAPGDFIVSTVGGITCTLPVSTITSDTQVTLIRKYEGPTRSGLSWQSVPRATQNQVTAELVAQATQALRILNNDKINWQQVFSAGGNITVTLPDGSSFTGPSWFYLANQLGLINTSLADKANTVDVLTKDGNLAGVGNKATARQNLGLGSSATLDVGTAANTVAAGNDGRLSTVDQKTGGVLQNDSLITQISSDLSGATTGQFPTSPPFRTILRGRGANSGQVGAIASFYAVEAVGTFAGAAINVNGYNTNLTWTFRIDGNAYSPSAWINTSDRRVKTNINPVTKPLEKMRMIRGCTWDRLDSVGPGRGFIAQDVQAVFPEAVGVGGITWLKDGTIISDTLSLDTAGVSAALHHEAILALMDKVEALEAKMADLTGQTS